MNIKRSLVASFFSLSLAVTALGFPAMVGAQNNTSATPILNSALARNTGGTTVKEAGDSVVLKFSETTNKFEINASNIATEFSVSNGHSFLDGSGAIGSATWSVDGEKLIIVLSAGTSLSTIDVGDTVTVTGSDIKDLSGNSVTGSADITGSFTSSSDSHNSTCLNPVPPVPTPTVSATSSNDRNENDNSNSGSNSDHNTNQVKNHEDANHGSEDCGDDGEGMGHHVCGSGLINGQLYKIEGSPTVYLLEDCRLKPFRGDAAFHSRGLKFSEVKTITAVPTNQVVSTDPVVPAEGTLVKGSDATVWFVSKDGTRQGFTSAQVFLGLGFKFTQVDKISDTDLNTISTDPNLVNDANHHPNGALIKCTTSPAIFEVVDNIRFPFANAQAFKNHGLDFNHILNVDCSKFGYQEGPAVTQ